MHRWHLAVETVRETAVASSCDASLDKGDTDDCGVASSGVLDDAIVTFCANVSSVDFLLGVVPTLSVYGLSPLYDEPSAKRFIVNTAMQAMPETDVR